LADVGCFGELVGRLRRLDRRCDDALRALARLAGAGEPEACLVVTAALLPLLIVRCGGRRSLVTEAINELAARVGEPAIERPASGVANRLLDRVMWRMVHDHGERQWQVPVADPASTVAGGDGGFETGVVDRLALLEFRRRLAQRPDGVEAWEVLAGSIGDVGLSSTQRVRVHRKRRAVRRLAEVTLVA
jgi:hypothetical protein